MKFTEKNKAVVWTEGEVVHVQMGNTVKTKTLKNQKRAHASARKLWHSIKKLNGLPREKRVASWLAGPNKNKLKGVGDAPVKNESAASQERSNSGN